ncbi:hypothetical protein BU15DRAFT_74248 [Melanogaster broomeanus]|nr:hypothetical protein BU15DRAFT_74248 [Melanogaster broomeanus]
MSNTVHVTVEQAQDIISSNDGNENVQIASFAEIKNTGYSHTAFSKTYYIAISDSNKSYLLLASPLQERDPTPAPSSMTLPALSILLSKILDIRQTAEGNGNLPGYYSLFLDRLKSIQSACSLASLRNTLSPRELARVELKLGTYLRALHGITNDWFGIPIDTPEPEPPAAPTLSSLFATSHGGEDDDENGEDMTRYSWQDTFVLHLEELLGEVYNNAEASGNHHQSEEPGINVEELRRYLSRAIGSFLFEDVEMPRLIWVAGNEEDVIVSLAPNESEAEADIAYILPTFGHALWGDPLMEAWFMPPGPSKAINEGYFAGEEGGTLIIFPRHKTKRVWYTVYLALKILAEERRSQEKGKEEMKNVEWAREVLPKCVEILKEAPCY